MAIAIIKPIFDIGIVVVGLEQTEVVATGVKSENVERINIPDNMINKLIRIFNP